MTVIPNDGATFDVYSGETGRYEVNLATGDCTCADAEHHSPADGCKHLRRIELEAGLRDIPAELATGRTDVELMISAREESEPEPEPEPESEPITVGDAKPARRVATDGGAILEPETLDESDEETHAPGCDNPECEGHGADGRPLLSIECWSEWAAP